MPLVTALIGSFGQLVALVCIVGGFLVTLVVIIAGLLFQHKRQQQWHDTARLALEKGQPLPPLPDRPQGPPEPRNDLRAGLILLAVGVGLVIFFFHTWLRYLGFIPGCIGVALLLYGALSVRAARRQQETGR